MISVVISLFIPFLFGSPAINTIAGAACIGFSLSFSISIVDRILSSRLVRWNTLFLELIVKTVIYVTVIAVFTFFFLYTFDMLGIRSKTGGNPIVMITNIYFVLSLAAGGIITLLFIFLTEINTLLGRGILPKFLTGHYHHPREEERIFMFMDISSSTTIAEKIGHMLFLSLLDDFFYDIAEAALFTHAEIYKYVGDEAILVWKMTEGLKNANCVNCFFMMLDKIGKEKNKYLRKYGLVPEFKAGVHGGKAVVGEMGFIKKEIAYIGDVVNTTARVEGLCNAYKENFLISGDIIHKIQLPESVRKKDLGQVKLRGKEQEIELFALTGN